MSSGTKTILKDGSPDMRQSRGNFCVRLRAEDRLRGGVCVAARVLSRRRSVRQNQRGARPRSRFCRAGKSSEKMK